MRQLVMLTHSLSVNFLSVSSEAVATVSSADCE